MHYRNMCTVTRCNSYTYIRIYLMLDIFEKGAVAVSFHIDNDSACFYGHTYISMYVCMYVAIYTCWWHLRPVVYASVYLDMLSV